MESSIKELSGVRLERAEEMLKSAKMNLEQNDLKTSLNRSYISILFREKKRKNRLDRQKNLSMR